MSDDVAREQREADVVRLRLGELYQSPVRGQFDAAHLKVIHRHLFQDLPHHQPGVFRKGTRGGWIKQRSLEGQAGAYAVHYARTAVETRITRILRAFGGPETLKNLTTEEAAARIASLYADLDHAHGFYEGNSRTLREFMRLLAGEAGYLLDWGKTAIGSKQRNQLYIARDVAVLERAFPKLTPERAMQTDDRSEYGASFTLAKLRRAMGQASLEVIIRDAMTPESHDP